MFSKLLYTLPRVHTESRTLVGTPFLRQNIKGQTTEVLAVSLWLIHLLLVALCKIFEARVPRTREFPSG
jgi:hypothetical protein